MLKEVIRPAGGVLELPNGGPTSPVHTRLTSLHSRIGYHQASVDRMLERVEVIFLSDSARCQPSDHIWDCTAGSQFEKGMPILSDSSVGKNSERMQASGPSLPLATNWSIVGNCEKRSRTTAAGL